MWRSKWDNLQNSWRIGRQAALVLTLKKNPKEECKAVMIRSRMETHVDERKAEKKIEEHKQQLADELPLEPVDDLVELEEIVEEVEGDEEGEIPIKDC